MKQAVWDRFCARFDIYGNCVPLFELTGAGNAAVKTKGVKSKKTGATKDKPYLVRSQQCDEMILSVTDRLVDDWVSGVKRFDGMLYMMGWKQSGSPFLCTSARRRAIYRNGGRKYRPTSRDCIATEENSHAWGDGYQYHIGDLSACVLPGHDEDTKRVRKYQSWADCLFVHGTTKLREPVYFWATEWDRSQVGIWEEIGPTSLSFLEYLLIGVAGDVSPSLLNREGLSRSANGG